MTWYLAFVPLVIYAIVLAVLARRWDREAPGDFGTWGLAYVPEDPDLGPLTVPPHPPHTQN
jgi:hypothetical protein